MTFKRRAKVLHRLWDPLFALFPVFFRSFYSPASATTPGVRRGGRAPGGAPKASSPRFERSYPFPFESPLLWPASSRGLASSAQNKIVWTYTDEAPALATFALLPVVQRFCAPAGLAVRASRAARVLVAKRRHRVSARPQWAVPRSRAGDGRSLRHQLQMTWCCAATARHHRVRIGWQIASKANHGDARF